MSAGTHVRVAVETYDLLHLSLDASAGMLDAIQAGLKSSGVDTSARVFNDMDSLARDLRKIRGLLMLETDRTPVGID